MKTEWSVGRVLLLVAWIGGCLVFAVVGFVGCSTVPDIIDNLPALTNAIPEPEMQRCITIISKDRAMIRMHQALNRWVPVQPSERWLIAHAKPVEGVFECVEE